MSTEETNDVEINVGLATFAEAVLFAKEAHKGQLYCGKDFFEAHLEQIVDSAADFGCGLDYGILTLAVLHDIVEDTPITIEDIKARFGRDIAEGVRALTVPKTGGNRKERFDTNLGLLADVFEARVVRLLDRKANMQACIYEPASDPKKAKMYIDEFEFFKNRMEKLVEYSVEEEILRNLESWHRKLKEHYDNLSKSNL